MENFRLALISTMYFEQGISQQEIASKLNLSKMTVSRMLQKAKEKGIVQIKVKFPFQIDGKLSKKVKDQYGIKKAIVIKRGETKSEHIFELIGQTWSTYLGLSLKNNYVIGLGLGNTIGHTVQCLIPMNTTNVHVVQLMGGLTNVHMKNPFTIVQEACRKLKAEGTYVTSSVIVDNREMRDSIMNETPMGMRVKEMWDKCDEALFGIGAIETGTLLSPELVPPEDVIKIKNLGAVGDIMGHCYNARGDFLKTHLDERLVNIPIDVFKRIPERVGLAGGEYKVDAIKGALLSGIVTTLGTDDGTAKKLVTP